MNVTQDVLINQIATKEDIDVATVRKILKSAENIVFDYLSSITPSEEVNIKLLNGINIKRKYIKKKKYSKGMFQYKKFLIRQKILMNILVNITSLR